MRKKEEAASSLANSTHLWQGVAPGSDGQTHRIFERAQDWHARGRYFWTSGVARERSPGAGVESGIVTASSRVPGQEAQRAWVRVLGVLGLGLGGPCCCSAWTERGLLLISSPCSFVRVSSGYQTMP